MPSVGPHVMGRELGRGEHGACRAARTKPVSACDTEQWDR